MKRRTFINPQIFGKDHLIYVAVSLLVAFAVTSKLDEGFTVDCPIIVGKAHEQIIELYEWDGMFVMGVMDVRRPKVRIGILTK
jgi:hypothetical protein